MRQCEKHEKQCIICLLKSCSKESQNEHLGTCSPCCISKEAFVERILLAVSAILKAKLPIVQLPAIASHDITEN